MGRIKGGGITERETESMMHQERGDKQTEKLSETKAGFNTYREEMELEGEDETSQVTLSHGTDVYSDSGSSAHFAHCDGL